MFKFLLVIFLFFVSLVFLMGFSILRTFKNMFFGSGKKEETRRQKSRPDYHQSNHNREDETMSSNRKKIIPKDEGEYVDFEEVK